MLTEEFIKQVQYNEPVSYTHLDVYKRQRKECCAGNAFYCIPGNGQDVLVKAGESLIVVNNAQNHTIGNPNSWDATKADFEWYDVCLLYTSSKPAMRTANPSTS